MQLPVKPAEVMLTDCCAERHRCAVVQETRHNGALPCSLCQHVCRAVARQLTIYFEQYGTSSRHINGKNVILLFCLSYYDRSSCIIAPVPNAVCEELLF